MDEIIEEQYEEQKERPAFLIVLLVMTGLNLLSKLYGIVTSFLSEREILTVDDLGEEYTNALEEISSQEGSEEVVEMIETMAGHFLYLGNEAYFGNLLVSLIAVLLGGFAVYSLYNLKKLGFHAYVLYAVISVFGVYFIMPSDIISTFFVTLTAIWSGIWVLLYAINFKHLK